MYLVSSDNEFLISNNNHPFQLNLKNNEASDESTQHFHFRPKYVKKTNYRKHGIIQDMCVILSLTTLKIGFLQLNANLDSIDNSFCKNSYPNVCKDDSWFSGEIEFIKVKKPITNTNTAAAGTGSDETTDSKQKYKQMVTKYGLYAGFALTAVTVGTYVLSLLCCDTSTKPTKIIKPE